MKKSFERVNILDIEKDMKKFLEDKNNKNKK